ncbi:diguanylate cyclase [Paenibacillus antri]|uniref:Diguanylate cyclase n=1 Tax=Paenibacillus antri TaxID=2582848 RepID=A0A5R9GFU8_9BACL|nr:diguanylate cyclase [Paenibacillus antri]TLS52154.1 diguanylate cyclase [Paenibacillus antri]
MKIGEFAERNHVTTKLLRHYDEIGLLTPSDKDPVTGYRSYSQEQGHKLNWILVLKSLDFSLIRIKELLDGPIDRTMFIDQLVCKRIEITSALNEQIQKKIAIDRLIAMVEKEGFKMNKNIDLQQTGFADVHEIKKNMPNMEMFLEAAASIAAQNSGDERISVFRFDISHFKQVNDEYGFDVGDQVIVACFRMIESNVGKHLTRATIGRAAGDEFIVFARASKDLAAQTAQGIIEDMKHFDFSSIGCPKQMGCYIGGLVGPAGNGADLRQFIENSIEMLEHARKLGPNSFAIEALGG